MSHADLRYLHETLDPLVGARVVSVKGSKMDYGVAPTLVLDLPSGERVTVQIWSDEEGNGPGALVITAVKNKRVAKKIPFPCPNCGETIDGNDLDGRSCPDCAKSPSCHACRWPESSATVPR